MRSLVAILACCMAAWGQSLEIRGLVQEFGSDVPVPGAEVTIKEFVLVDSVVTPKVIATLLTNPRGEYSFHPEHVANFYILARKDGYEDATSRGKEELTPSAEQPASVTQQQPLATVPALWLIRPGEISGKVVDGDGNPRAGLPLRMSVTTSPVPIDIKTDRAGEFRFNGLASGKYLIRIAPTSQLMPEFMAYSESEAAKIDEGVEYGYWPGGANDPQRALPVQVEPGSRISVGTLVVRTVKYPRVHVTVEGDCINKVWGYVFRTAGSASQSAGFTVSPCEHEFLLKFVPPEGGTIYTADLKSKRWASAEIVLNDRRPATAALRINEPVNTPVRLIPPEGVPLSSFGKIQAYVGPADPGLPFGSPATLEPDASGRTTLPPVPWSAHRISLTPMQPDVYVKTVRYLGRPLNGPVFEDVAGGTLELELDNNAPMLTGMVTKEREATYLLLVRWPAVNEVYAGVALPFQYQQRVTADGSYTLRVAPGEYRAIAMTESRMRGITSGELRELLAAGERVAIERGEEKTLDLKVSAR